MRCSICQKPISDPETLSSGIGEICLRKLRFAENLNSHQLDFLINKKEKIPDSCIKKRSLILKSKNNDNTFVTILSSNEAFGKVLNRTKLTELLSKGQSFPIAYFKSVEKVDWTNYLYASSVNPPKDDTLLKLYKSFTKIHKDSTKDEENIIKEKAYRGMLPYYRVSKNTKNLTKDQLFHREDLFNKNLKQDHNWNNYYYHYATIQQRLHLSKNDEAHRLLNNISHSNVKSKDYGLTDMEIQETLKFNKKAPFDYFLINCFFEKNPNINYILDLYESLTNEKGLDRIKKINIMKLLGREKSFMTSEEVERLL